MLATTFQLHRTLLGIVEYEGTKAVRQIPLDAVVRLLPTPPEEVLIRVEWEGCTVQVFAQDLWARATPVEAGALSPSELQ